MSLQFSVSREFRPFSVSSAGQDGAIAWLVHSAVLRIGGSFPAHEQAANHYLENVIQPFLHGVGGSRLFWCQTAGSHLNHADTDEHSSHVSKVETRSTSSDDDWKQEIVLSLTPPRDGEKGCTYVKGCCFCRFAGKENVVLTEENIFRYVACNLIEFGAQLLEMLGDEINKVYKSLGINQLQAEFVSGLDDFSRSCHEYSKTMKTLPQLCDPPKWADFDSGRVSTRVVQRPTLVSCFEQTVERWITTCDKLLAHGASIAATRENDGTASSETWAWRRFVIHVSSILENIETPQVQQLLGVLAQSEGRAKFVLEQWNRMCDRMRSALAEGKDNTRYLQTLERYCERLHDPQSDFATVLSAIPSAVAGIRIIYCVSCSCGTEDRVTMLFVGVTERIVEVCRKHLNVPCALLDNSDITDAQQRIRDCLGLRAKYVNCYRGEKAVAATSGGREFSFSESAIFGKLDLFATRLEKISELLEMRQQFHRLQQSNIDGIEEVVERFGSILQILKHRSGDYLDAKSNNFDVAFADFQKAVTELSSNLVVFVHSRFLVTESSVRALKLWYNFQQALNDNSSTKQLLEDKFVSIFAVFGRELEQIRTLYESNKSAPPIERNMPPVAGAVSWARQLFRRIEEPMKMFQKSSYLMASRDARRAVQQYNKLAETLCMFEAQWVRAWTEAIQTIRSGLNASLLLCEEQRLFSNFDPRVLQLLEEVHWLRRLGVSVPKAATTLLHLKPKLLFFREEVNFMINEYHVLIDSTSPILCGVVVPLIQSLNATINPGLGQLTWLSAQVPHYLNACNAEIRRVKEVLHRVNSALSGRLEVALNKIVKQQWIVFNSDPAKLFFTTSELLQAQAGHTMLVASKVNDLSVEVADTLKEITKTLVSSYDKNGREKVRQYIVDLFVEVEQRVLFNIIKSMQESLSGIRARLSSSSSGEISRAAFKEPLLQVEVQIQSHTVVIVPSTEDIQRVVNKVARMMLEGGRWIYRWNQEDIMACDTELSVAQVQQALLRQSADSNQWNDGDDVDPEDTLFGLLPPASRKIHDIYLRIGKNRALTKSFLQMTGVVGTLQRQVDAFLQIFKPTEALYTKSRSEGLEEFLSNAQNRHPSVDDFESKIKSIDDLEREVDASPAVHTIGCLLLDLAPARQTLKGQAMLWKQEFGQQLATFVRQQLDHLAQRMEDLKIRLSRSLHDLFDVNIVASTLATMRNEEGELEAKMTPILHAYDFLQRYNIRVPREDMDLADSMVGKRKKLLKLCLSANEELLRHAPKFKIVLIQDIASFESSVTDFLAEYAANGPNVPGLAPRVATERLKHFSKQHFELTRRMEHLQRGEALYGMKPRVYDELESTGKELRLLTRLYSLYNQVLIGIQFMEDTDWYDADFNTIDQTINAFKEQCTSLPKSLHHFPAYHVLKQLVEATLATMPYLPRLRDRSVRPRHWEIISRMCKTTLDPRSGDLKIKNLFDAKLPAHSQELDELLSGAMKEADIENKLNRLAQDFTLRCLTLAPFKNRGNLQLKSDSTAELLQDLEDGQTLLGSLLNSRYNEVFKKEITSWSTKLAVAQERLEEWLDVQHSWIYMEAVFIGTADIAKEMPVEVKRFSNIDRQWGKIMRSVEEMPNLLKVTAPGESLANMLPHLKQYLDQCQKSLVGYMHTKRVMFPRFFFLSDAQLLDILGHGTDPTSIQSHMPNLTSNITTLNFDGRANIVGFSSAEGEEVSLNQAFATESDIVAWLNRFIVAISNTMQTICCHMHDEVFRTFDNPAFWVPETVQYMHQFPAQVAVLGLQLLWTSDCEMMLLMNKTDKLVVPAKLKKSKTILDALIQISKDSTLCERDRVKLETMITIQIHQLDVMVLLSKNIRRLKGIVDFDWVKQLRCNWRNDKEQIVVSITDVDFNYGYEYIGCVERLVVTDLTDRIYISCAQAMGMHFGGAPMGPAGTGKTETTRDLGRACGMYFIVINCSEMMNGDAMSKLIRGIAQSGCWCGFDEINRIEIGILSVVASQIACVFHAQRDRKRDFLFTDGSNVLLNPECGIFVTMNPNYSGRTELPENMKSLFRPVAVVVPDRQAIIRVRLAAAGFQDANLLAKRLHLLYQLASEQLSQQTHYDFGLRSILSVLRTSGPALRNFNSSSSEASILLQVVKSMNQSKLLDLDSSLFDGLLKDIFPETEVGEKQHVELRESIHSTVNQNHLYADFDWVNRVVMIYDQWLVRHGLCLMGPVGCGKSTLVSTLQEGMKAFHGQSKSQKMNPKALLATQMFGSFDAKTGDWSDGVFVSLWRKATKRKNLNNFLVVDGPVDSVWIENLNSVLDDTKVLTLANGDRLALPSNLRIIFESDSLEHASPATVSRLGLVYVSEKNLPASALLTSWVRQLPSKFKISRDVADLLAVPLSANLEMAVNFLERKCRTIAANPIYLGVTGILRTASAIMSSFGERTISSRDASRIAGFAIMWGVSAFLNDMSDVEELLGHCTGIDLPSLPVSGSPLNYYLDHTGAWKEWLPEENKSCQVRNGYVITADTCRVHFFMSIFLQSGLPFLVAGEAGTGKTSSVQHFLKSFRAALWKQFSFSYATHCTSLQKMVLGVLEKGAGNIWTPGAGGKTAILFIDDVQLPEVNEWGDQPTNELLRQLLEDQGSFLLSHQTIEWAPIANVQFCGTMRLPDGVSSDVPRRLKRHFAFINMPKPQTETIVTIFNTLFSEHFNTTNGFSSEVAHVAREFGELTHSVFQVCREKFLPTPTTFHYSFNLKDLSRLLDGMLLFSSQSICNETQLGEALVYETLRTFGDKLVTDSDHKTLHQAVERALSTAFGSLTVSRSLKRVDYVFAALPGSEEDYGPHSIGELRKALHETMKLYNDTFKKQQMHLVWSDYFLTSLFKVTRVLTTRRGNVMLVGVGGSGKQSLIRMAAFAVTSRLIDFSLNQQNTASTLVDEMKEAFKAAAFGKKVTFLLSDNEELSSFVLELASTMLSSGELPTIYPKDELELIHEELRNTKYALELPLYDNNVASLFTNRVRDNIHLACCFTPTGPRLRNLVRRFPSFLQCTTTIWFPSWPESALIETATAILATQQRPEATEKDIAASSRLCAYIHNIALAMAVTYSTRSAKSVHTTPKNFLDFLSCCNSIYQERHAFLNTELQNVTAGLQRMATAQNDISVMRRDLNTKQEILERAAVSLDKMVADIQERSIASQAKTKEVEAERNRIQEKASLIASAKEAADKEMEAALPTLWEAENALRTINSDDISTVKKLHTPPTIVRRILDAVLILKRGPMDPPSMEVDHGKLIIRPSWGQAKIMINDIQFLSSLMNFTKDAVTAEQVELLLPYVEQEDFTVERARTACGSLAGLCTWIKAMIKYYHISRDVLPKMARVRELEIELKRATATLKAAEEALEVQNAKLKQITDKYNEAQAERAALQRDTDSTRRRLTTAEKLIEGLTSERKRWDVLQRDGKKRMAQLIGDSIICAAFLNYCGPFDLAVRTQFLARIRLQVNEMQLPGTADLVPQTFLIDQDQLSEWRVAHLPQDDLSIQNAVLSFFSRKSLLLVDPQSQGRNWEYRRHHDCLLSTFAASNFLTVVEEALSQGKVLLVEDIDTDLTMLTSLRNIITRNFVRALDINGTSWISVAYVGTKEVVVAPSFKLVLSTKHPTPALSPEHYSHVTVLECGVTHCGLEEQLLSIVIQSEKASLELDRAVVLLEIHECEALLHKYEQQLLSRLAAAEGNLLDNVDLVDVLSDIKDQVLNVNQKLDVAKMTEASIATAREEYSPIAVRGGVLFFSLLEMGRTNNMYTASLDVYIGLFRESLEQSAPSTFPGKRILAVEQFLTNLVCRHYIVGYFNDDKQLFLLSVALGIQTAREKVTPEMYNLFLAGRAQKVPLDHVRFLQQRWEWLPEDVALNVASMAEFPQLKQLILSWETVPEWHLWFTGNTPEQSTMPGGMEDQVTPFHRLLLIRLTRLDRFVAAARRYVCDVLGPELVQPVAINFFRLSTTYPNWMPLMCLLAEGVDPSSSIELLARKQKIPMFTVSMGTGQEPSAQRAFKSVVQDGGWLLLQNVHLTIAYCSHLAESLRLVKEKGSAHHGFRLWLTAAPTTSFPVSLLQLCYRLSDEPPRGMKAGLLRSYMTITQDQLDSIPSKEWRQLLFTLCFLHSTLTERRKFGSLGWSGKYEFTTHDLAACTQFAYNHMFNEAKKGVLWKNIQYMVAEVHYGGRITDSFDKRVLYGYCDKWLCDNLFCKTFEFAHGYIAPDFSSVLRYREYIESLPGEDNSETWGLHDNADIAVNNTAAQRMLFQLLTSSSLGEGGGLTEQRETTLLSIIQSIQEVVVWKITEDQIRARKRQISSSVVCHMLQELEKLRGVVDLVRKTCSSVFDALGGLIAVNTQLNSCIECLLCSQVPQEWLAATWPASTLQRWVDAMKHRLEHMAKWVSSKSKGRVFSITALFFPQGFLTAVKQELTHLHSVWTLDSVQLKTEVTKSDTSINVPDDAQYFVISGLVVEGAQWDRNNAVLCDSLPRKLYSALPLVKLSLMLAAPLATEVLAPQNATKNVYSCPIYRFSARGMESYVCDITLRTDENPSKWVLRGVAALCMVV